MRIIKLTENKATVYHKSKYYYVSDNGEETLIFLSDSDGNVKSYRDVGGAKSTTLKEVLGDFDSFLYGF